MKTIEFMRSTDPLFYYCNCTTFKRCPVDHSGTYVLSSEADQLRARNEALEAKLAALVKVAELCIPDEGQIVTLEDMTQHLVQLREAVAAAKVTP